MTEVSQNLEPYRCSHCEKLGEVTFSCFQKQQQVTKVRVWVNNLPEKLSEAGVKNLFLSVGKPLYISYNPRNNSALVEFQFLNEAELAVRDLHCKPPYNLKVTIANTKHKNISERKNQINNENETTEPWDFSVQDNVAEIEDEEPSRKPSEVVSQIRSTIKSLHFDPSIRMRQNVLDFKTAFECVSRGRGYLFMGKTDHFVGGLQKFEFTTENSKAKDEMTYFCNNCNFLTTKICGRCSGSYCSKLCLEKSDINHRNCCSGQGGSDFKYSKASSFKLISSHLFNQVPIRSGCWVIMSAYHTMKTVAVRRVDHPWDEKFSKLCNDVACEAFKGKKLKKMPKVGDVVIARYMEDLCFYRARVTGFQKSKINLVFIDFGNNQETNLEDLQPMPDYLKSVPDFAVRLHLKNVSDESSPESVSYYNNLTADKVVMIVNFEDERGDVFLIEKESKTVVNDTVITHTLPSWKKDETVLSKLGEIFYLSSLKQQKLEIGGTCNLMVSHFDETEFLESEVFWVTNPETDAFFHANSQMYLRIREYCQYLKNDAYLPRVNELCLAKEGGEWHRCVNLKSQQTTCCLFFLDDGHSSLITTNNIRKMIKDFTEAPSQAICCTLPDNPKLKTDKEIQEKTIKYLKSCVGKMMESVGVLKLMGDAYCLSIPEIKKLFA